VRLGRHAKAPCLADGTVVEILMKSDDGQVLFTVRGGDGKERIGEFDEDSGIVLHVYEDEPTPDVVEEIFGRVR
jgi:hypothetical protein